MNLDKIDIVVVGAGIAGFAAAISAANENKKVLLIEKLDNVGGNATNANVGTICGLYFRTFSDTPRFAGYQYLNCFVQKLISLSENKEAIHNREGLFYHPYEWSTLQTFLEKELIAYGVQVLKSSEIIKVEKEKKRIQTISVKTIENTFEINPKTVIDCSGNGIISQLANLEMIKSPCYQSASQIFRVENILSENEFSLNMSLKKAMINLVNQNNWSESFKLLSVVPGSLKNNQADFKITLQETITDNDEANTQLGLKSKMYVEEIFSQLIQNVESLKTAKIKTIFPQLGIRIQQRSKGKYILSEEDVLSCKKFDSGIALGTWPIEEWQSNGKLSMEYFESDDAYMIPAECLVSYKMDNLFFAGKNISATTKAIASARVMGTCLQTGYAAGKLASCSTLEEREKKIDLLNKELLQ